MDKLFGLFLIVLAIFVGMMENTGAFRFVIAGAAVIVGILFLLPSRRK